MPHPSLTTGPGSFPGGRGHDALGQAVMANDLLQLDHDALLAYRVAIAGLSDPARRERWRAFRDDHLRHVMN